MLASAAHPRARSQDRSGCRLSLLLCGQSMEERERESESERAPAATAAMLRCCGGEEAGLQAAGHAWNAIRGSDTAPFSASSSVGVGGGVWIFRPACQSSAVKPDSTRHDAALRNAPL